MSWRRGQVHIDDFLGPFDAEIDAETRWNGFACPRFTRGVAEEVAKQSTRPIKYEGHPDLPAEYQGWRWDGDVLVMQRNPEVCDDSDEESWGPDKDRMYHVGSWAWTWYEVEA